MEKKYTSPNFNERREGKNPSIIVIHYTGMKDAQSALERLCDPAAEVSAHYVIEENGKIHALVPEDKRAWHAGVSSWSISGKVETDINSASIGIELVNPGLEHGYRPFPDAQMQALAKLCKEITARQDIKVVLGHSDIAPNRKQDPGDLFDWQWLANAGTPNIHAPHPSGSAQKE